LYSHSFLRRRLARRAEVGAAAGATDFQDRRAAARAGCALPPPDTKVFLVAPHVPEWADEVAIAGTLVLDAPPQHRDDGAVEAGDVVIGQAVDAELRVEA